MSLARLSLLSALAGLVLLGLWSWQNRDYYGLAAQSRPVHPHDAELRSSGRLGLACGLVGTALLLLNLSYLLRKRMLHANWLGSLRTWMGFHVATGLLGSGLILVHSAYLPRSVPGILAMGCIGIVVCTGLVGRYIHAHVPRTLGGRELEREELLRRLEGHRDRLRDAGFDLALLGGRKEIDEARRTVVGRIMGMLAGDRELRRAYRRLRRNLGHNRDLLALACRNARDEQRLARYSELRGLMASWRFLHRWLAIVMLAVVVFHVFLALRFGDLALPFGGVGGAGVLLR